MSKLPFDEQAGYTEVSAGEAHDIRKAEDREAALKHADELNSEPDATRPVALLSVSLGPHGDEQPSEENTLSL